MEREHIVDPDGCHCDEAMEQPMERSPAPDAPEQDEQQRRAAAPDAPEMRVITAKLEHASSFDGDRWVQVPDDSSVISELETPEFQRNIYPRQKASGRTKKKTGKVGSRTNNTKRSTGTGLRDGETGESKHHTPRKGTAASKSSPHSNGKVNSAKSKTSKPTDVVAAQNLAKARVRAQRIREKKENDRLAAQQQERSESQKRQTRFTAEEGHARARARVKLRKLKQKALAMEEGMNNGSRPPSASPNRTLRDTASRNDKDDLVSIMSTLSMDAEAVRSYLLADDTQTIASNASSRRPLTVPNGPKFALEAKYGDKTATKRQALLSTDDDVSDFNTVSSVSTWGTERSVTIPKGPKFLLEAKYGEKGKRTSKRNSSIGHASTGMLREDGIKRRTATTPTGMQVGRGMLSNPPKLHCSNRRHQPKSTLELQEQEMKKQFRARPMPKFSKTRSVAPTRRESTGTTASSSPHPKVSPRKPGGTKTAAKKQHTQRQKEQGTKIETPTS